MMKKKIDYKREFDGLNLVALKEVESEAIAQLIVGRKIVLAARLMLEYAEKRIRSLGGLTAEEEDVVVKEQRRERFDGSRQKPSI